MTKKEVEKLIKNGWKVGDSSEFLKLNEEERKEVNEIAEYWCDKTPCRYCDCFTNDDFCKVNLTMQILEGKPLERVESW